MIVSGRGVQLTMHFGLQIGVATLDGPLRQIDIGGTDRAFNGLQAQTTCGECEGIDIDPYRVGLGPEN